MHRINRMYVICYFVPYFGVALFATARDVITEIPPIMRQQFVFGLAGCILIGIVFRNLNGIQVVLLSIGKGCYLFITGIFWL